MQRGGRLGCRKEMEECGSWDRGSCIVLQDILVPHLVGITTVRDGITEGALGFEGWQPQCQEL